MTKPDSNWTQLHDGLREELHRETGSVADRVAASIGGRTPRELSREHDAGQLRRLTMAAAVLLGALVLGQVWSEPTSAPSMADRSPAHGGATSDDAEVPSIIAYEEEAATETDIDSILAALLLEGRSR
ncbi:MAG: hypothetical protein AAF488_11445 [Planctomycetota bacterium]